MAISFCRVLLLQHRANSALDVSLDRRLTAWFCQQAEPAGDIRLGETLFSLTQVDLVAFSKNCQLAACLKVKRSA